MTTAKPMPGNDFPQITLPRLGGGTVSLGTASAPNDWQLIIVYRGKHCPRCTTFLTQLKDCVAELAEIGVEIVAVSGDTQIKAEAHLAEIAPNYAVGYDLSIEQMRTLGLYISSPRSPQETDVPFSEPGLFVVNELGQIHVLDIGNASWTRPALDGVVAGLKFIRGRSIGVRGTF